MKYAKVITGKSDAKAIWEYGVINKVPFYNALTDVQSECLKLVRCLDNLIKKRQLQRAKFTEKNFRNSIKVRL